MLEEAEAKGVFSRLRNTLSRPQTEAVPRILQVDVAGRVNFIADETVRNSYKANLSSPPPTNTFAYSLG